ncbi:G-D-S-L family lipolytic protein [Confluentibacter sediminis]|uniref:G-D-S-L family lipolytic protein n=1 Tax=Confluentibacter sediminis TaxID=2219045 RepID=UPI001F17F9B4|nr:G-D-S-L family lipolytic protein [Confluentibacter sediminis]
MKTKIMNTKYIWLLIILIGFSACNDIDDIDRIDPVAELPELTSGTADFSNYVAIGASFTAGFTDNALFKASQENSFPNILSQEFAKIGGGSFVQPLTSDNYGGLAAGGTRIPGFDPRLVFGGAGPVPLESVIGPVTVSTDIALNKPTGPFNNMGVPGAKSYHLLFNGYGNIANLATKTANPYFVRMASSSSATMLGDAMAQNPTFFTLSEIGGNDVLGYALSGGDGTNTITPSAGAIGVGFDATFGYLVTTLTSGGAKGVVTNVPYVKDLPHFTTVPYNPIPLDATTAGFLNSASAYGAYNVGIVQAFTYLVGNNLISQADANAEIAKRTITFTAGANNAVVIMDEDLTDLTGLNPALVNMRQATAEDLLVLPASSFIGTLAVPNNPQTVNGVAIPLADKWVLTPEEQLEIKNATDAYNTTIASVANSNPNIALVDLNSILQQATANGVVFDNYILKTNLVTGGAIGLDGVHLTARGYAYLANKFLEAIDAKFGSNFIASGNVAKAGDYPTNYSPTLQ